MIEHEIIILGLLKESPKHGYQIKKKIREILSIFAGVELKSIYYPLRVLEKKGMVAKQTVRQEKRPERFVYTLTPKGQRRFEELLEESFLKVKRPQFSLDLSLYFLNYMKPTVARRRLRGRMLILSRIARELQEMVDKPSPRRSACLSRILEHNLGMLYAEMKFLNSLIRKNPA